MIAMDFQSSLKSDIRSVFITILLQRSANRGNSYLCNPTQVSQRPSVAGLSLSLFPIFLVVL